MELPSKILEQIASKTKPKLDKQILIVMDRSTHEEHLSQPLQTKNKQFKIAVTILTDSNGIFNVTNSNKKIYSTKSISDEDGFIQITITPGADQIESLSEEIKKVIIHEGHFTEASYPFETKPIFSTLGSIIEISPRGLTTSFMFDDSIRDLLKFNARAL